MSKHILFGAFGIFATAVASADSFGTDPMVLTSAQMDSVTAGTMAGVTVGASATSPILAIAATKTGAQVTQSGTGPLTGGAGAAGGGAIAVGVGGNSSTSTSASTQTDNGSSSGTVTIGMNGTAAGGFLSLTTAAVVQVGINGLFRFP